MKSHIVLKTASGKELAQQPDSSITIHDKNPLFNEVDMYSFPFELPLDLNRAAFKNIDARDSKLRAADIEGEQIKVIVDGIPYRQAVLHVQQDQELDKVLPVNLDSRTKTFRELIEDLKCRDLEAEVAADRIIIGEKIGDIYFGFKYHTVTRVMGYRQNHKEEFTGSQQSYENVFVPPATGFSYPGRCSLYTTDFPAAKNTIDYPNDNHRVEPEELDSFINVSQPYPQMKYCNTRICYAHYGLDDEGKTSSDITPASKANYSVPNDKSPYWVLEAKRSASGICFYMGYFLEKLFQHLGVAFDMSALTAIEDFNYMAFITTACKYTESRIPYIQPVGGPDKSKLASMEAINKWLSSRGLDGRIDFNKEEAEEPKNIKQFTAPDGREFKVGYAYPGDLEVDVVANIRQYIYIDEVTCYGYANQMFASADNFPDASISEVISSLEETFGVRFVYDAEINKVTVKLLRDVFRDNSAPIHLRGQVLSMRKMTEKIMGVRVKYSAESDPEEQRANVHNGVRDYDTDYDYIEYPAGRTQIKPYDDVVKKIDVQDMNVYVDATTGDAFRIKVDSEATTAKEMKPTAFEVGQFKGIEEGDCSKDNEDYIQELSSSFKPVVVNDVNSSARVEDQTVDPQLVPFIDVKMEHEFVESKMSNPFLVGTVEVYLNYIIKGVESYDPSSTDDGSSPLQNYDWGLTVGILRTGDNNAGIENYDPDYDGFGNWRWRDVADDYCVSSDTMDQRGMWLGKTDQANTFSLKLRAWKPFVYYKDWQGETHVSSDMTLLGTQDPETGFYWLLPCMDDERDETTGAIKKRIRSRGLVDVFLAEYIFFLLNRQKYKVRMLCETAQLADLPRQWLRRFEIDGKIGWINDVKYDVKTESGIGEVEIEFFAVN